jgi:phytoene desaturase
MEYLERRYLPDLRRHIVTEHRVDPRYFHDTLNSHLGSAFSVQPLLTQSAWFRPHCQSEDVSNLYFVGAGTHPGAGIPGVLSSAKIVEKLLVKGWQRADGRGPRAGVGFFPSTITHRPSKFESEAEPREAEAPSA